MQYHLDFIPGRYATLRNIYLQISYRLQTTTFHHVAVYQFIKTTLRNVIIKTTLRSMDEQVM
jgi:hypothetical protein